MTFFGKLLAVLNVLAAVAFAYLAVADWAQRQNWSYAVFREDLAIAGLPVEKGDTPPLNEVDRQTLQLTDAGLQEVFKGVGDPVRTQHEEVDRVHKALQDALDKQNGEAAKRQKLKEILVPLARSGDTRDALIRKIDDPKVSLADLLGDNGPFQRVFLAANRDQEVVVADTTAPNKTRVIDPFEWALHGEPLPPQDGKPLDEPIKRGLVAHLLFNLPETDEPPQRVLVVIGLQEYALEGDGQAQALVEMTNRAKGLMAGDQTAFVIAHQRAVKQLQQLAATLADRQAYLARQQEVAERVRRLIEARKTEINGSQESKIEGLVAQLARERAQTQAVLQQLAREQQLLFEAQDVVGSGQATNERLLHEIERLEGVRQ